MSSKSSKWIAVVAAMAVASALYVIIVQRSDVTAPEVMRVDAGGSRRVAADALGTTRNKLKNPQKPSGVSLVAPSSLSPFGKAPIVNLAELEKKGIMDPFGLMMESESSEEALWLRRSGFPTPEVWANRSSIPETDLEAKASQRDLISMALLADRIWERPGRNTEARNLLTEATARGSIFANNLLALKNSELLEADFAANPDGTGKRRGVLHRIVLETLMLSIMMGDGKAVGLMAGRADHPGAAVIGGITTSVPVWGIYELNRQRAILGLQPYVPVPRPIGYGNP